MDPASFGLGVLGAVVQLYRFSLETYELYLSIRDFTPAFRTLRLAIDVERMRLELWARHIGLGEDGRVAERLQTDSRLLELTKSVLTEMSKTLEESAVMLEYYREAEVESPPVELNESK